jgi:hypothetical protein
MIDRQRNKILFECDSCSDLLETEESEFYEANTVRAQELRDLAAMVEANA